MKIYIAPVFSIGLQPEADQCKLAGKFKSWLER